MNTRDGYINELKGYRAQAKAIDTLGIDGMMELTDQELDKVEAMLDRAGQVADILEAVDHATHSFQTEHARHNFPGGDGVLFLAQKSTLELLNATARRLSGREVSVVIEQPRNDYPGLCTWQEDGAIKLQISPSASYDLDVFLHEVAHAKLHTDFERSRANAWKMEQDAKQQAQYWTAYATKHEDPTRYAGEGSGPVRQFRSKLITLLLSEEAAETIGTY
jgi:hypothetical protein